MQIRSSHLYSASRLVQNTFNASSTKEAANTIAKNNESAALSATQTARTHEGDSKGKSSNGSRSHLRSMRYAAYLAGSAYLYDKTVNDFFLSTTSLNDGKQGFTSDARLQKAEKKAEANYHAYHNRANFGGVAPTRSSLLPKLCGENLFVTMLDFRAATKVHMKNLIDTKEAHDSIANNISCIMGERVKPELLKKHGIVQTPPDFDITKGASYDCKNKYSLSGVPNQETGSYGYASRSVSNPFIEKGENHHARAINSERALTPRNCVDALQPLLQKSEGLSPEAQFRAGQALLILRPLYCSSENWGDAHKVLMPFLEKKGLVSSQENQKLGATRPFTQTDMEKGIARRNTSLAGPTLNKLNIFLQKSIYKKDEKAISDLTAKKLGEMKYIPIAHFKMNEDVSSFEDSSGLADSFTGYNVSAYINHARLLSGEDRLSKKDVIAIVGCLNAIYDNASSERHTLREIAHGCFVGAGYTVEDAEDFYNDACKAAATEFYGGRAINVQSQLYSSSVDKPDS
ncbi:type III effector HopG1 [Pseudomonas amygdali pv. eriobotryae]|uniref:XopAG/AvrGf1 family type III secretion system effector n=1 Tax=Pseudomonas amygdali TaxID=47877 RepID=UPI0019B95011|nr:XopAG/AvrGf1 family type III secretion system effector [Pseudomonas amygdali]UPT38551.1 type III effector HopG1 [Pseudomonas amygdali pv. loropetali]GFZ67608.1 type III effector HopG1 [Pseudomonas amygdali pv. eriobotryae]